MASIHAHTVASYRRVICYQDQRHPYYDEYLHQAADNEILHNKDEVNGTKSNSDD
jgi:hypothetical protein